MVAGVVKGGAAEEARGGGGMEMDGIKGAGVDATRAYKGVCKRGGSRGVAAVPKRRTARPHPAKPTTLRGPTQTGIRRGGHSRYSRHRRNSRL